MRIVVCPGCGHQNRSAIVATICDQCGDDISTVMSGSGVAEAFELEPEETVSEPTEARASDASDDAKLAPEPRGSIMLFALRFLAAGGVVATSVYVSLRVPLGSALAGDAMLAGSVAILGGAAAVSGLIMIVIGAERKSSGMTLGMRLLGIMLAFIGTWCVATISTQGGLDRRSAPSGAGIRQSYDDQLGIPGGPGWPGSGMSGPGGPGPGGPGPGGPGPGGPGSGGPGPGGPGPGGPGSGGGGRPQGRSGQGQ